MAGPGYEWPTPEGASLDAWLAGWEHRIAGRPADRWTALWNAEQRYDNRPHECELSDRAAAEVRPVRDLRGRRVG